ncbi:AAA family ATPase [Candidatus Saccharibacteria bacterium]|jgi:dephospho-CoA kinase|nr:AAA family ATPase [Candidatus Saccharibacteria bacterium]
MSDQRDGALLIGISGSFASGKDVIAELLAKRAGYTHVSSSDMVRAAAKTAGLESDRTMLRPFANKIRDKNGADYFTKIAFEQANSAATTDKKRIVVSGLRAKAEADFIKNKGGVIIFVDAPLELRFDRAQSRKRDLESYSKDIFERNEKKESQVTSGKNEQNIYSIKENADIQIVNDGTIDDLWRKLKSLLPNNYLS